MGRGLLYRSILAAGLCWSALTNAGNNYTELLATAVKSCTAIDSSAYQSSLFFNPDGYRSYYQRSFCFQAAAVRFREPALCAQVKERRALLSSSWGYSSANCQKLVTESVDQDRQVIDQQREQYASERVQLDNFIVEQNGNGRDFDIVPSFSGRVAHSYLLRFELIPEQTDAVPVVLHTSRFHLRGKNDRVRIHVRSDQLRERFPEFTTGRSYAVRATMTFIIGTGTPAGYWSDAFIESRFPLAQRTQSVTRQIHF